MINVRMTPIMAKLTIIQASEPSSWGDVTMGSRSSSETGGLVDAERSESSSSGVTPAAPGVGSAVTSQRAGSRAIDSPRSGAGNASSP